MQIQRKFKIRKDFLKMLIIITILNEKIPKKILWIDKLKKLVWIDYLKMLILLMNK